MVFAVRRLAVALCLCAGPALADLELTPEPTNYNLDGARLQQWVFHDGNQRVTYAPPRGWRYSGGGDRLLLSPPSRADAEAAISRIKLPEPQTFDEPTMKRLCGQVVASLPPSATNVVVLSQEKNPLLIERKETFLVVINYDCLNLPYTRSVLFLNRKNDQLRFQLTASRASFTRLQKEFFSSHFSWQNL